MESLTKTDLNFILSRCPKDILEMLRKNPGKLFLAGGFIRSVLSGEKISDIDLFSNSSELLFGLAKDLTLNRKGRYFKTDNALTVISTPRFPVQFITRWKFNDALSCIKSFDFTVCQAVIWAEEVYDDVPETKIIFQSAISNEFYPDLAARRLVYTFPQRDEEPGGSFLRMIKFIKRGYNIQVSSIAGVISRIVSGVRADAHGDEKWMATIITGLLRQVDPLIVIDGVDFIDGHEVIGEGKEA